MDIKVSYVIDIHAHSVPFFFFLLLVTSHDRLVSNSTGGTWLEFWKISKS